MQEISLVTDELMAFNKEEIFNFLAGCEHTVSEIPSSLKTTIKINYSTFFPF